MYFFNFLKLKTKKQTQIRTIRKKPTQKKILYYFLNLLYHFAFQPAMYEGSLPIPGIVKLLNLITHIALKQWSQSHGWESVLVHDLLGLGHTA